MAMEATTPGLHHYQADIVTHMGVFEALTITLFTGQLPNLIPCPGTAASIITIREFTDSQPCQVMDFRYDA
jgi:hypothetical protein